jgi:polysaccharide biosynthesis transport protein
VSVVDPAVAPGAPSKPRILVDVILGALLGILGGLALAFVFENLNPKIHTPEDLAQDPMANLPILGRLPAVRGRALGSRGREKLLVMLDGAASSTGTVEAFRRLNSVVLSLLGRENLRQIVFVPMEAVSDGLARWALANLAVATAEAGKQVVLVDADLRAERGPSLHGFFGLKPGPGLAEVIGQPEQLRACLYETGVRGLRLLPAGGYVVDPTRVLAAASLESIVARLSELAEVVLWNCPAPTASAQASRLAPVLDGVVLIIRQGVTTTASLDLAMAELKQIGARPLGVIYQDASVPDSGKRRRAPQSVPASGEPELEQEAPSGQPRPVPVHTSSGAAAGQAESTVVMSSQAPRGTRSDSANHNLAR